MTSYVKLCLVICATVCIDEDHEKTEVQMRASGISGGKNKLFELLLLFKGSLFLLLILLLLL